MMIVTRERYAVNWRQRSVRLYR